MYMHWGVRELLVPNTGILVVGSCHPAMVLALCVALHCMACCALATLTKAGLGWGVNTIRVHCLAGQNRLGTLQSMGAPVCCRVRSVKLVTFFLQSSGAQLAIKRCLLHMHGIDSKDSLMSWLGFDFD